MWLPAGGARVGASGIGASCCEPAVTAVSGPRPRVRAFVQRASVVVTGVHVQTRGRWGGFFFLILPRAATVNTKITFSILYL